jgi:transcriptional/translational regulatory protein YebC/TACO1
VNEDAVMEIALDAGAEDVATHDDSSIDVVTTPEKFGAIKDAMENKKLIPVNAEVVMNAATTVTLDQEGAEKLVRLIDMLEDLDDVQDVYSNANIPQEVMEKMG